MQINRNSRRILYRFEHDESMLGLIGKNKHEPSVHIILDISRQGPTELICFEGILNARGFQRVFYSFILPFISDNFPFHHRLHMDN